MAEQLVKRPPVNEVVLSVAIEPQPSLVGPRIPEILGGWFEDHPNVQPVAPYTMPIETIESSAGFLSQPFNIQFSPEQRYWLISEDDAEILQVQSDYLALNWRRREASDPYVGYETLRERFAKLLEDAQTGLRRTGGNLAPERGEITYVNIISPNEVWSSPSDAHRLFNLSFKPMDDFEQFSFTFSRPIQSPEGQLGRLHVSVQPAFNMAKSEPVLQLSMTARSTNFELRDIDSALKFADSAHKSVIDTFLSFSSDDALRSWGLLK